MQKSINRTAKLLLYSALAGALTNQSVVYETRENIEERNYVSDADHDLLKNVLRRPIQTIEIIVDSKGFEAALRQ